MVNQIPVDISVKKHGEIAVLQMSGTENRINTIFLEKWMKALDKVESWPDVKALVTTGSGKFYSNGLDLEYLTSMSKKEGEDFSKLFLEFRRRLLFFPMVTVAAINGHAFAGGLLITMLHDYRVMQSGRGWVCMNEIDIGLLFSPSLKAIMTTKFTPTMIRDITVYGNRFTAQTAFKIGLIDEMADEGNAVSVAINFAKSAVKGRTYDRQILHDMKVDLYSQMVFDDSIIITGGPVINKLNAKL